MRVPFVDLAAEHTELAGELFASFRRVVESGRFVLGAEVERFEAMLSELVGARHAIGVSSGTDALLCMLGALDVGPGDEVVTTPYSFVSTVEAIVRRGAVPRFVDVDLDSYTLIPSFVERAMSPRTRAILPVHLFGHPADLDALRELAQRAGVALVEDSAQALGAAWKGRRVSGCFSFFPTKPLGALGDAGAIVTDDADVAERCQSLRQHGVGDGRRPQLGGNFRIDALQAALLASKLPHLPRWLEQRAVIAARYADGLSGIESVRTPTTHPFAERVWSVYTIRVLDGRRDALAESLARSGIETRVYYRAPLHRQEPFATADRLPNAERLAREALSLPIHPTLGEPAQRHVIDAVRAFFGA